jgi:hypothetical protein
MLLILAAVVVAGDWRPMPSRRWLAFASAVSLIAAIVTVTQLPRSLRAWPSYGVTWSGDRESGRFRGAAGFNVLADRGNIVFRLTRTSSRSGSGDAQVTVQLRGQSMETFVLPPRGTRDCRYPWPDRDLVFVEVDASRVGTGEAVGLAITPLRTGLTD